LVIPNCHADQTFSVSLEMEENVAQDPSVYLQSALLYTNSQGERRIRVHTYCLTVTQNLNEIIASANANSCIYLMAQHAIQLALKSKLADARNYIQTVCGQSLSSGSSGPETLKALPLYSLGLLKSVAFRDAKEVTADLRSYHWFRIETLPLDVMAVYCYPRLLPLHSLETHHGTVDEMSQVIMPESLSLTNQQMTQEGVYLLEDGETMLMWIGKAVNPDWLFAVFAVQSVEQLHPEYAEPLLGSNGNPLGARVAAIIKEARAQRVPPFMKLYILRQGDPNEYQFFSSLIEDRSHSTPISYAEFLQKLGPRTTMPVQAVPPSFTRHQVAH